MSGTGDTIWAFWPWMVLIGVIITLVVVVRQSGKRRTQALTALATQMGFSFTAENRGVVECFDSASSLLPSGDSCEAKNFMTGTASGMRTSVFDYRYDIVNTAGDENSRSTYSQTVVAFASPRNKLPQFELTKKGKLSFLQKHVKFESSPDFSNRFLLTGSDHDAIRRLFNPQLAHFLLTAIPEGKLRVSGEGPWLALWTHGKLPKPEQLRRFLQDTSQIASEFFRLSD